jgi:hypothetical protein
MSYVELNDKYKWHRSETMAKGSYGQIYTAGEFVVKVQEYNDTIDVIINELHYNSTYKHPCLAELTAWSYNSDEREVYFVFPRGTTVKDAIVNRLITYQEMISDTLSVITFPWRISR